MGVWKQAIKMGLPEELTTRVGLLEEALRVDPEDIISRQELVAEYSSYLHFTLHELPAGVLYGMHGATVAQCDELLSFLADFISHVSLAGNQEEYAKLIEDCAFHFQAYRDYKILGMPGDSYKAYLESRQA